MRSAPTVIRSEALRGVLGMARAAGGDVEALLERHGLPKEIEGLPEMVVPLEVQQRLPDDVAALIGDPFLGLHVAAMVPRGQLGVLDLMLRSAPTLRQALRLVTRYVSLINDLSEISFDERADEAVIEERIPGEPLCGGRHVNEMALAMVTRIIRESCRSDWRPRRVWFAHPPPNDVAPLEEFFGTPLISFGAGANGLAFGRADLDLSVVTSDHALLSILEARARAITAQGRSARNTMARIRESVRRSLEDGPTLARVAASVGMSRRTLQRRLAEDGLSFVGVVDDVRSALAVVYLGDRTLRLSEIAFVLGYADLPPFLRAFKRWTGRTPTQYRESRGWRARSTLRRAV